MILEPAVQAHVDAAELDGFADADIVVQRTILAREIDRMFTLFGLPGPEVHEIRDHELPVEGGSIVLRVYRPSDETGLPAHVLLHGGGWMTGSIDELVCDATARHRAVAAHCVVVLVEYRLAPEHQFPTAVYDTVAAVRWVREHADRLGVDAGVVTLGGASAGANLATAAVLADPGLDLAAVVLEVPALDLRFDAVDVTAMRELGWEPLVRQLQEQLGPLVVDYLGGDVTRAGDPLASPVLAPDLSAFPETHILTAELDVLRDGAERFAARLRDAGRPVSITRYDGALHGSPILTAVWPTARRWHDDILTTLADIHRRAADHGARE